MKKMLACIAAWVALVTLATVVTFLAWPRATHYAPVGPQCRATANCNIKLPVYDNRINPVRRV